MNTRAQKHFTRRTYSATEAKVRPAWPKAEHKARVRRDLRRLGVSRFGMSSMEAKHLPRIIHPTEQLGGVVYGFHQDGYVMLVATDRRIIFLDKKPLFINEDEISYFVVSGISFSNVGWGSTVTLHTRIQDYTIRTFNRACAESFVEFIELRCLENYKKEDQDDYLRKTGAL